MSLKSRYTFFAIGLTAVLCSGCASLDRIGTKMDIVAGHLEKPGKVVYEGKIEVIRKVGSVNVIQFANGTVYDVPKAPPALYPGDTVRIYSTDAGYEALLWKPVESSAPTSPDRG